MGMTDSTNKVGHDEHATDAPGEEMLVDVGGRSLYIRCRGEGSPTVILEHGMATESDSWAEVQEAVAQFTSVCAFDRAGRGKSDPAPKPRTSEDMVADLHTLLANARRARTLHTGRQLPRRLQCAYVCTPISGGSSRAGAR